MNCMKCGANLGENDMFCPVCGTPVQKTETNGAGMQNAGMNYNYEGNMNGQQNYTQPNNYGYDNNNNMNYNNNNINYSNNNMNSNNVNNNNINNANNKSGGNNTVKICVIVIIIVAVLVALGFIGYAVSKAINKNKDVGETPSSSDSQGENSGSITQISNKQTSSYKVNCSGFDIYIPDDLVYEMVSNGAINISDNLSTWEAQLTIQKTPFQQLKQKKNQWSSYLSEYLAAFNAKTSDMTLEKIDGIEFLILEIDLAGTHEILAIAELNSMYSAYFEIVNEDNDYDRETLKNLTSIVKTSEYEGDTKSIESKGKLDPYEIGKTLQKAIEE